MISGSCCHFNVKVGTADHSQEEVLLVPVRCTTIHCLVRAKPGHSEMEQTWLLPGGNATCQWVRQTQGSNCDVRQQAAR